MRIARHLTADRPQPEPFGGVVAGRLHPPVIEMQHLRPAAFQEKLSVIAARHGLAQDGERAALVEQGLEGAERGIGHGREPS